MPASRLLDTQVLRVSAESLVNDLIPELVDAELPIALVTDEAGRLVGIVGKRDLVARRRRQVILVDHSERSQSADGIEEAEILEIVDHHRLGGLETAGPIEARLAPVGCTATLILRRYNAVGLVPPREMAWLLVAAILSDTMLLKSPTTTAEDVAAVEALGAVLGEDALAFGGRMYNAKFDVAGMAPGEIATSDLKTMEVGDAAVVQARKAEILEAMAQHQVASGLDLLLLMVTDIRRGGTELLAVGRTRVVERAFGTALRGHAVYLPGVFSRKKQIVPPLATAF